MRSTFSIPFVAFALQQAAAQQWDNPDGGNTNVQIGDGKVNFGYQPPWNALDSIKDNCPSNGCNSGDVITVDSAVVVDGEYTGATISLSVEGSFNDEGEEGNRDDLVEIAKTVVANSQYDYTQGVEYTVGSGCQVAGFTPCDPGETETVDEYKATNLIVIRVEDDGGSQLADMSISISIEVLEPEDGVCETITAVGGAMAGAVNGILGGIFTLAGLGCG